MTSTTSSTPSWHTPTSSTLQVNSVAISANGQRCIYGSSSEFGTGQFDVYCYDGSGNQLWKKPFSQPDATQGVFWVAISEDGQFAAAGGEVEKHDNGLLTAYSVATGNQLLNVSLSSRVNQVSLSADGQYLLAVFGGTIQLYSLNDSQSAYDKTSEVNLSPYYLNSAVLSIGGQSAAVSAMMYSDDDSDSSTSGAVFNYNVDNGQLIEAAKHSLDNAGPMRVAITQNGECFGASLHDGSCIVYRPNNTLAPLWQFTPDVQNLSLAYALDMTLNDNGQLFVACGANLYDSENGGYLYLLTSRWQDDHYIPQQLWDTELQYAANPGVSLDSNATYVTATDGKPSDPPQESPGNFYLFDVLSGEQLWSYQTSQMNWPMMLAADASAVFGGSDDGAVYYWDLTSK